MRRYSVITGTREYNVIIIPRPSLTAIMQGGVTSNILNDHDGKKLSQMDGHPLRQLDYSRHHRTAEIRVVT